ncbi:unnamed protein product [Meloidogyne enterolobii]|uniref:Uncharacterized protein n=1 Tax=Meloidogyne enterolobii TaxID=390850 RepID=A0ACB1B6T1_MELEN
MTGKNFDKWLKDANVIDGKLITTTMTGITQQVIINVAKDRSKNSKNDVQAEIDSICSKLEAIELPTLKTAIKVSTEGNVYERLTDHNKYTGAHKERFDTDGKGKGKAGREDIVVNTGYVSSYKNAG